MTYRKQRLRARGGRDRGARADAIDGRRRRLAIDRCASRGHAHDATDVIHS